MDYDRDIAVDRYRDMQRAVAGVEALYLLVRAPHLRADLCFDGTDGFEPCLPWFIQHAQLQGQMGHEAAMQGVIEQGPSAIAAMPIIGDNRMSELFAAAGFERVQPVFRGLWYAMWAVRAG